MADSRARAAKEQDELGKSCASQVKECPMNDGVKPTEPALCRSHWLNWGQPKDQNIELPPITTY